MNITFDPHNAADVAAVRALLAGTKTAAPTPMTTTEPGHDLPFGSPPGARWADIFMGNRQLVDAAGVPVPGAWDGKGTFIVGVTA